MISNKCWILTSIHLESLLRHTTVLRTVGYHIPCKSAGDIGIELPKQQKIIASNASNTEFTKTCFRCVTNVTNCYKCVRLNLASLAHFRYLSPT